MVLRLFAFDEILQGHIRTRKYNNCFQIFWLLQKLTFSLSHLSCSVPEICLLVFNLTL